LNASPSSSRTAIAKLPWGNAALATSTVCSGTRHDNRGCIDTGTPHPAATRGKTTAHTIIDPRPADQEDRHDASPELGNRIKVAAKHRAVIETPHGKRTCFQARVERTGKQPLVARFGGIPLARRKDAVLLDRVPKPIIYPYKELTVRLRRSRCELCEQPDKVQVHQIRKLAQLAQLGADQPAWAALMARMRRKTLVVCHSCHQAIHHRQPAAAAA
jgi:hypothetical protein